MWSLSAPRRPNVPGLRLIMQGEKETKTVYSKKQVPRGASRGENFKKGGKNKLADNVPSALILRRRVFPLFFMHSSGFARLARKGGRSGGAGRSMNRPEKRRSPRERDFSAALKRTFRRKSAAD